MREAGGWRFALARHVAASYARSPNAEVVMIAGSVGRGSADCYSDIEVDVYYSRPPTDAERVAVVEGCGGTVVGLEEDADEWEEQMLFDGFRVTSSTFLSSTMERYLTQVVERGEIAPLAQVRLFSLQHAVPAKGHAHVDAWRARASAYPDSLVHAMLREYLPFHGLAYADAIFAARDDLLLLYRGCTEVARQILGALLGLNRIYLPTPEHLKGMDEIIEGMHHRPDGLETRLKQLFHIDPTTAVDELRAIADEVLTLVEAQVPAFDTAPYRARLAASRGTWDAPPDGIRSLLDDA